MIFRKLRGVNLPYREQGRIWFTCVTFDQQPKKMQAKIRRLADECGGEHAEALFQMLTRENVSINWLESEYHVERSTLYRRRVDFFHKFAKENKRSRN